MNERRQDIEDALFGSPSGFLDIVVGAVMVVFWLVVWIVAVFRGMVGYSRNRDQSNQRRRHRA